MTTEYPFPKLPLPWQSASESRTVELYLPQSALHIPVSCDQPKHLCNM